MAFEDALRLIKQVFNNSEKTKKKFKISALNNTDYKALFGFFLEELPSIICKFLKIDLKMPNYKHVSKKA